MFAIRPKMTAYEYPEARIIGHRELPHVTKECPCFTASEYYRSLQPKSSNY